jgi:accessory gene regulator B
VDAVFIMGLFIVLYWVPAGTEKKVVRDVRIRQRLQGTMILLGVLGMIANVLFFAGQRIYLMALFLGTSEALLFVTPAGYRLLNARFVGKDNQVREDDYHGEHSDM